MNTQNDPLLGNSISGLMDVAMGTPPPSTPAAPWRAPSPGVVAALLPQYGITRMIGRGGMGAVYAGTQLSLNRAIALKLLPAELSANADFVARFTREAQTLASLSHQGIVTIFDFGTTSEGHLFFVMEFIDGTDLAHVLRHQKLGSNQVLELTIQICEALHFAHAQGVVHRDIKPANVLITRDGRAKLADFGLARPLAADRTQLTASHLVMGTPDYMAPEQWTGHADHRADIYALGVMLYEMLTGTKPQGAFDLPSIKAHVDARLDEVVVKAMRQEPERRYQAVSELRNDVDLIRTTRPPQPVAKHMPRPPAPTPAQVRQPRTSVIEPVLWGLLCVLIAGLGWGAFTLFHRPTTKVVALPSPPVPRPVEVPTSSKPDVISSLKPEPPAVAASPAQRIAAEPVLVPPVKSAEPEPIAQVSPPPAPEPKKLEVLSKEAPNAINWSLAALEDAVPADIRQNLTVLREDIIDEGKARPSASLDAYRAAFYLCDALLNALNERDKARVASGFRNAQAAASQSVSSQALEARRNYMMSWPQYAREQAQRDVLQSQADKRTAVAGAAQKVAWNQRADTLRRNLDALYAKFRAAMR